MPQAESIAAVSRALKALALEACGAESGVDIALRQPANLAALPGDGVAIILWKAEPVTDMRNSLPSGRGSLAPEGRAFAVDLHYLLVPHAGDAERQQRLLGLLFQKLARTPTLNSGTLNSASGKADAFASTETLQLLVDPATALSGSAILPALATLPAFIPLHVRGLSIDARRPSTPGAPVVSTRPLPVPRRGDA